MSESQPNRRNAPSDAAEQEDARPNGSNPNQPEEPRPGPEDTVVDLDDRPPSPTERPRDNRPRDTRQQPPDNRPPDSRPPDSRAPDSRAPDGRPPGPGNRQNPRPAPQPPGVQPPGPQPPGPPPSGPRRPQNNAGQPPPSGPGRPAPQPPPGIAPVRDDPAGMPGSWAQPTQPRRSTFADRVKQSGRPFGRRDTPGAGSRGTEVARPPGRTPRRAQLQVARLEPWSVMKFSFVMSLVCFVILLVAVVVLYVILSGLGVFDALTNTLNDLTRDQNDKTGGIDAGSWFSFARVFGYTVLVGALNVLLITALSTVGSVIYNQAADLVGGVEVTLKESE